MRIQLRRYENPKWRKRFTKLLILFIILSFIDYLETLYVIHYSPFKHLFEEKNPFVKEIVESSATLMTVQFTIMTILISLGLYALSLLHLPWTVYYIVGLNIVRTGIVISNTYYLVKFMILWGMIHV